MGLGLGFHGLGFRVWVSGFWVWGLAQKFASTPRTSLKFRVQGPFCVQAAGKSTENPKRGITSMMLPLMQTSRANPKIFEMARQEPCML